MEIRTTRTRVICNAEVVTENAKYFIEYEKDGVAITLMNVQVNNVMISDEGMVTEDALGYIFYDGNSYSMQNFPENENLPKYVEDVMSVAKQLKSVAE